MNRVVFAHSSAPESGPAAAELAKTLQSNLAGRVPQALLVFASSRYNHGEMLAQLQASMRPAHLIGCSSAGEFVGETLAEGSACALAFWSDEMSFSSAIATGLSSDPRGAAERLTSGLLGPRPDAPEHCFRTCLVFCDALAGNTEILIDEVTRLTAGQYQLVGGGAGDDAQFSETHVFFGSETRSDAAVLLEILSDRPLGIGVSHGWEPVGTPMRVTESVGMKLVSLNAEPAADLFRRHAEMNGQILQTEDPIPFFLHNVVGIKTPLGWKLRVPLAIDADGAIHCASDMPQGAMLSFMKTTAESSARAAEQAIGKAVDQLGDSRPGAALFFDCVATRLRMGAGFGLELETIKQALGGADFGGYNTYGQIARCDSQFSGFHNCTAVVCIIPE